MSAHWITLFIVMILAYFGQAKQDELNEIRREIEKLDKKIDYTFNELKQLIVDDSLYNAIRDMESSATNSEGGNTASSRPRRDVGDARLGNAFVTLYEKTVQTSSDVKMLLYYKLPALTDDIISIKDKLAFCERPKSCLDHLKYGHIESGVYRIYTEKSDEWIKVYCDQETDGGGWTVFQRRQDGSVDFYLGWSQYETGFGDPEGEFWLGNENLYRITSDCCHTLRIDLGDFDNKKGYAKYSKFMIGSNDSNYVMTVDGYSGDIGDCLYRSNGRQFSTKDRDHDISSSHCAQSYKGAWWYWNCMSCNLNGLYITDKENEHRESVSWRAWKSGHYPLKFSEMKLREHVDK